MASTTLSTSTTSTATPLCKGGDISSLTLPGSAWCFCLYTGRCLSHFNCSQPLPRCQEVNCGETSLQINSVAASFYNIQQKSDVLTIPVQYFRDIGKLAAHCPEHAQEYLAEILAIGRGVYAETVGAGAMPEWQCVHLYPYCSVPWLHVHSFTGDVSAEELPGKPPFAACAKATVSETKAAAELLALAGQSLDLVLAPPVAMSPELE
eukprot:CAMPEP_0181499788 /NCGR_PEP_ID=MMETSP1110-20121109/54854_1 /TAXON_ID=174948 /ORGANISM="Symbiodinium sp., Strain CCMP421" /LENGTH=206 /DNA_ID=CAMNT_0023628015 /DNA_START=113 /DNA_END=733 /DNA_ORIENTATION=+